jgi:excinuclease ABC subunit A
MTATLRVSGARVHNLRSVSLEIPKRKLVVFTGPSGSGKSSLAFDTLFAEGQRRYVESLSVYARQFLGQMQRPDVDEIVGLSPTISIEQKSAIHNPRSTVGTVTEVHDYLRLLYARLGRQHCYVCGEPVRIGSVEEVCAALQNLASGTRFQVLAPLVRNRKGEFRELFEQLRTKGYTRARVDGEMEELIHRDRVAKSKRHTIEVVIDRLVASDENSSPRLIRAVERALQEGAGSLVVVFDSGPDAGQERTFSSERTCCGIAYPELTQQSFSFNSPLGQCPTCAGLGSIRVLDPERLVPNHELSLRDGAIAPLAPKTSSADKTFYHTLLAVCRARGISVDVPWRDLPEEDRSFLFDRTPTTWTIRLPGQRKDRVVRFEGVLAFVDQRLGDPADDHGPERFERLATLAPCPDCEGTRLRPESRAVRFEGHPIGSIHHGSIDDTEAFFRGVALTGTAARIGNDLVGEILARLRFLREVGVGYLQLGRSAPTLSGGEAQRIRLAGQLGSELSGVLYVLDEPSIGLHQRDNRRLLDTLARLRDQGNSVVVVEHDRETMESADWVVDFGPGAGSEGGDIVFSGKPADLRARVGSVTGDYLAGRRSIEVPAARRRGTGHAITVRGARGNNLQDVTVSFPLGVFTCVTGVSGSGKSSLVNHTLYAALANHLYREVRDVLPYDAMEGIERIDKVLRIDQQPIGRTPRSNPATYTKLFDEIRALFAQLPDARIYGYGPGRFSFNVRGGRCETCQGGGSVRVDMGFLADGWVPCETCQGRRFNESTLRVRYNGLSIADVLDLSVRDALPHFEAWPKVARRLRTLEAVGLGYMRLGQPSTTLSGGEAQRIKLSRELSKIATGDTLYILDEPSTGLHFDDIRKLLEVIHLLVDAGNTVVMIEHNLDMVQAADHVIDLGPEGGAGGGQIVASGTPEDVARVAASHTGRFLAASLGLRGGLPTEPRPE